MTRLPQGLSFAVFLSAVLVVPTNSSGQEVVPVRDPPTCEGCEITLEHVVTLGDREGPGRVMPPLEMVRDSEGNYLVAHGDGGGSARQVWIFDPEGTFLRTFGRAGEGPGEYLSVQRIDVLPGDTLEIYDPRNRRKTTLSPDLTVVSTQSFEGRRYVGSEKLPDGRFVITDHQRTPGRVGYPLQLVSQSGKVQRAFGNVNPEYRPREPVKYWKSVALGLDGGSVWSVGWGDYLIERWDTTGTRRQALQREADWFEPYVLDRGAEPNGPTPQPQVRYLESDPEGRLWVLVRRAKEDWREIVKANPLSPGESWDIPELWDWVLEVIEPTKGELVVSQVLPDGHYNGFLDEGMVISYREDDGGFPFLDVWRPKIIAPPTTQLSKGRES